MKLLALFFSSELKCNLKTEQIRLLSIVSAIDALSQ